MEERAFETVRLMRREELEEFAVRAALQMRNYRREVEAGDDFIAVLLGFLLGAVVAASGLLFGLGLS
jgi:hypothetical protein